MLYFSLIVVSVLCIITFIFCLQTKHLVNSILKKNIDYSKAKNIDKIDGSIIFLSVLVMLGVVFSFTAPFIITGHHNYEDLKDSHEIGDTVGGLMGPIVALVAAGITFLAFWVQYKANEQQKNDLIEQKERANLDAFETTFFQMMGLHRDNVSDFTYEKYMNQAGEMKLSVKRKVVRVIYKEFQECYEEVNFFSALYNVDNLYQIEYKEKIDSLYRTNDLQANFNQIYLIEIAYCIMFYGVGADGIIILQNLFKSKYNSDFYLPLLQFIQLKPKEEQKNKFAAWVNFKNFDIQRIKRMVDGLIDANFSTTIEENIILNSIKENKSKDTYKYYGGHQHRLGHYFRHLFQSYKFLNSQDFLTEKDKYFYGKTLRAQLSTYEQALLFINSITCLGLKWEINSETNTELDTLGIQQSKMITRYSLIKNLPGEHLNGIYFKEYYPKISYESYEL